MTPEKLRQQTVHVPPHVPAVKIRNVSDRPEIGESMERVSAADLDEIARRSDELHHGKMKCDHWRQSLGRLRDCLSGKSS